MSELVSMRVMPVGQDTPSEAGKFALASELGFSVETHSDFSARHSAIALNCSLGKAAWWFRLRPVIKVCSKESLSGAHVHAD